VIEKKYGIVEKDGRNLKKKNLCHDKKIENERGEELKPGHWTEE